MAQFLVVASHPVPLAFLSLFQLAPSVSFSSSFLLFFFFFYFLSCVRGCRGLRVELVDQVLVAAVKRLQRAVAGHKVASINKLLPVLRLAALEGPERLIGHVTPCNNNQKKPKQNEAKRKKERKRKIEI